MKAETLEVRQARVEEGIVRLHDKIDGVGARARMVADDVKYIRGKLDALTDKHWQLYVKVAGIAAVMSIMSKFIKIGGF